MRDTPIQVDGLTSLNADPFNDIPNESKNLILSTGQTLSAADPYQVSKAVAEYAARGDVYSDTGSVNQIELVPVGLMKYPTAYTQGMRARFKPAFSNSSSSVTVKIGTLSAVGLSESLVANGDSPDVFTVLRTDKWYTLFYTSTPDGNTNYWLLDNMVDEDDILTRAVTSVKIDTGAVTTTKIDSEAVTTDKIDDDAITTDKLDSSSVTESKISSGAVTNTKLGTNISLDKISQGELTVSDGNGYMAMATGTGFQSGNGLTPNTRYERRGMYPAGLGTPGNLAPYFRPVFFNIAGYFDTNDAAQLITGTPVDTSELPVTMTNHRHQFGHHFGFTGSGFDTGIAFADRTCGATVSFTGVDGGQYEGIPVILKTESVSGNRYITHMSTVSYAYGVDAELSKASEVILCIFMDGANL